METNKIRALSAFLVFIVLLGLSNLSSVPDLQRGIAAIKIKDYQKALIELTPLAKHNAESRFQLANLYSMGWGIRQDIKRVFALLTKAANQGHVKAQTNLGSL